jgi:Arc/MetJ family transcription regulator
MTIQISENVAEAALRAASKSGYKELVQDLLRAGVKASSFRNSALTIAKHYGHEDIANLLNDAIEQEKRAQAR